MIGERIKLARKASGLSLRALADQAGISAMAISKYENGKITPSSDVLLSLAKALGVRVEYFLRQSKVTLQGVDYRKHARLAKKTQAQIEGDVVEQLERFLELLRLMPSSPVETFKHPAGLPNDIHSYEEIEKVALATRKAWGLGRNPIPQLTDMLEEHGVMVFQSEALHDNQFDGLAVTVDGMPVIVVGRGWPGDRQRFTLAHELGHFLLKGRLGNSLDIELAANRFAGAFLVSESEARKELGSQRTWLDPNELCVLKGAYGLSMNGWLHRAKDLNILSVSKYQAMARYFRKQGWHINEPCKNVAQERPQLFCQLIFRALAEQLISASKAAELMRLTIREFRNRRNMERAKEAACQ